MIDVNQFRRLVVTPTLDMLGMYSKSVEELLVFTCATESKGGTYIKQIQGPALGVYQMEPATHQDVWGNYIKRQSGLMTKVAVRFNINTVPEPNRMIYDMLYSTMMARLMYRRFSEPLPNHSDIDAIWEYYKKYWNTELGAATKKESIDAYKKFAGKTIPQAGNDTLSNPAS
jgi:hypothetical protein